MKLQHPYLSDLVNCVPTKAAVLCLLMLLTSPLSLSAQSVRVVQDGSAFEVWYSTVLSESDLVFGHAQGYDTVGLLLTFA